MLVGSGEGCDGLMTLAGSNEGGGMGGVMLARPGGGASNGVGVSVGLVLTVSGFGVLELSVVPPVGAGFVIT
jgi:hypothetical protein